ncbi:hypothetical protein [Jiella mangrovi]|uniref:Uncharacterized protein n=1 Tax=Jiella mangrovi TaxID=2821407 RepID=A0ABS4BIV4_9HYPH|nr:hypothetical protein [Jiella mangrovi]MBP0616688.1 hypothetical protein [Jiella mangrovi]
MGKTKEKRNRNAGSERAAVVPPTAAIGDDDTPLAVVADPAEEDAPDGH